MQLTLTEVLLLQVARWLSTIPTHWGWLSSRSFHPAHQIFHFPKRTFAKHLAYMTKQEDHMRLDC